MSSDIRIRGQAKLGVHRRGKRIYLVIECPDQYEAMRFYETWQSGEFVLNYSGPRITSDSDDEACDIGR